MIPPIRTKKKIVTGIDAPRGSMGDTKKRN
jgi:hypothetical protein